MHVSNLPSLSKIIPVATVTDPITTGGIGCSPVKWITLITALNCSVGSRTPSSIRGTLNN